MKGLLMILNQKVSCCFFDKIDSIIELGNDTFKEIDDQDYSGFYDWLREDINIIIGLRFYRFDGFGPIFSKSLNKLPYVKFVHEKVIEIYLTSQRNFNQDISNDQDFGVCKVYRGDVGFAFLLDISYLTDAERSSILLASSFSKLQAY